MTDPVYTLHVCDEREFRHRFLPALTGEGDEAIVRELLDAANAAGPSWTALHKTFDETRPLWNKAIETQDGAALQTSGFGAFARLQGHLRPAYAIRRAGLSHIDRAAFPELASYLRSPGVLLLDEAGEPLPGIPANIPSRVPGRCQGTGRSGGAVVLAKDVRPFLKALRGDLPRLAEAFGRLGLPAEEALTVILAATVEAKLRDAALFEACDALANDVHIPEGHLIHFPEHKEAIPLAVRREAARVFGHEVEAPPEPPRTESQRLRLAYSPQKVYRVGDEIEHKSFGAGEVTRVLDSRRLKVSFAGNERTLVQGLKAAASASDVGPEDSADSDSSD